MKRITRIARIRNLGVFQDYAWGSDLIDFGRYNLIYGWNGSGKTTLSRLFRNIELRESPKVGETEFWIDGNTVPSKNFSESSLHIRVFNREFVDQNVFPFGDEEMKPIFILGAENIENQKKIERAKEELEKAERERNDATKEQKAAYGNLDQYRQHRAKAIKEALKSGGENLYNNYNKGDFKEAADRIIEQGKENTRRLSDTERENTLAQCRATQKQKLQEIDVSLPNLRKAKDDVLEILATTVISESIASLKEDPDLADWARQGLKLHRERKSEHCQFCQQQLPNGLLETLEAHFNARYERFVDRIDKEVTKLKGLSADRRNFKPPHKLEFQDDLAPQLEGLVANLSRIEESIEGFANQAVQALEHKRQHMFEFVPSGLHIPNVDTSVVERVNQLIQRHNMACDEFETLVDSARNKLADHMIVEDLAEYVDLIRALNEADAVVQAKTGTVQQLQDDISQLEREITNHRQPAEELNEDIHKYLGHSDLSLQIKETGYAVTRRGVPAESLSEGETTAIALLYFLKALRDRRFNHEEGIVVLDDPVSSLDANALFLAFGFIKERTKDVGQLFILTHNFSLFRQVRNWFGYIARQKRKDSWKRSTHYYMLATNLIGGKRISTIQSLDPLLQDYDSEYQYLFALVYRASNHTESQGLENNYFLPNVARRMLEMFLAFRMPHISRSLWDQFQEIQFDEARKTGILRFLHTQSHMIHVGEPEHDLTGLSQAPLVLRNLLDMMRALDEDHCKSMERCVAA